MTDRKPVAERLSPPIYNTLWLLTEKILVLILSFAVTLAIARHLLPESFGRLSYWLALVSLSAPLMALGLNSLISRELLLRSADRHAIMGSALLLRGVSGIVVAAVAAAIGCVLLSPDDAWLLAVLLFASASNAALVVDFWLQAKLANRQGALLRLAILVLFSGLRLAAVAADAELAVFVYLLACEYLITGIGYFAAYGYLGGGLRRLRPSLAESRQLLCDSRWLMLSGISAVLYLKIDQVMLGLMVGERAVGIYAVAAKFSEVWYFVPAALVTAYFPQLIERRMRDAAAYAMDLQKLNDALFTLALMLALAIMASADWFIPLLFGEAYRDAVPVLLVHIWAAILVFMRALLSKWLITENLLRLSLLSQTSGAIVNIAANFYLIPRYGALGAAYATLLAYVVAGYLVLFVHPNLRPMGMLVSRSLLLPIRLLKRGRRLYHRD